MYSTVYHTEDLSKSSFLITGGAGFIGSNLVEYLLKYNAKKVRVLDNFSTGFRENLEEFIKNPAFELIDGDIRNIEDCRKALSGIDYVSHQAALGSVPRSINDPITTNDVNIGGTLNMLVAARDENVKRFIYAASSSTYGDSLELPKVENKIGIPLSPYGVTKYVSELYADVFSKLYGLNTIGLRYFNVFGPKQNPKGEYAAVIPLFMSAVINNNSPKINGDGSQTRDFTFIENAVQANVRAFFADDADALNTVYNIAVGTRTSLLDLMAIINELAGKNITPEFAPARRGDIKDSLADISKASGKLRYNPLFDIKKGLAITYEYFHETFKQNVNIN